MYIAANNSFTDQKKQGVSKSLKSASFHVEILDSIKFGMRPYLNKQKRVERQNKNGSTEILKMAKNMEPVWVAVAVVVEEVAVKVTLNELKNVKGVSFIINEALPNNCFVKDINGVVLTEVTREQANLFLMQQTRRYQVQQTRRYQRYDNRNQKRIEAA